MEIAADALLADEAAEAAEMADELQASDMEKLLADLRDEPDTDAERAAKFALFEAYLETVTKMREQTFAFWQESKPDFVGVENPSAPSGAVREVEKALNVLAFSPKKAARIVKKVLESAIANAENNDGADVDELKVSTVFVDEGMTMKRIRPRAKGRADRILKRTCHITVKVSECQE